MNSEIKELRQKVVSGVVSAKEIALDILGKIAADDHNCFISVLDAVRQAEIVDEQVARGFSGLLAGVPIAIKDNMKYIGSVTACGSSLLSDVDTEDAQVVKRLKAEGAVIVGKTNMDEFAMGSSNRTSHFGPVLNPVDKSRVPGGSSGGSAAAVKLGLCYGALGSDTGGSIRQPASYCGVVGFKPTIGSIDGTGMYPLSQDMDQIGPLARSVEDAKLLFEVLGGKKVHDVATKGLKIGLIKEQLVSLSPEAAATMDRGKEVLLKAGCDFVEVSAPSVNAANAVYTVLGNINAADNIRGLGSIAGRSGLGQEVKKRILIGEYALSHAELVKKAAKVKRRIISELDAALSMCDCLLSPAAPTTAFGLNEVSTNNAVACSDLFTQPPSIAGLPALSVPCLVYDGLPIGIQLAGKKYAEDILFSLGKLFENT